MFFWDSGDSNSDKHLRVHESFYSIHQHRHASMVHNTGALLLLLLSTADVNYSYDFVR